jgi:MoaA/NifB/PqqE/SkfB family radical SAM enzyme
VSCYLPWTQGFINVNGVVSPCCAPLELGNMNDSGIGEIFNGKRFTQLRADLATGGKSEVSSYCDGCYTRRKLTESGATFESAYKIGDDTPSALAELRHSHPDFVNNYEALKLAYQLQQAPPENSRPLRLEVQIGEHCNIRCIMCWQDHAKPRALTGRAFAEIEAALPYVTSFLVTGGEPTIFKEFWRLVEMFKATAMPEAELQLLTHGQQLKSELHRFRGIRRVSFAVNIDGPTRESYEHIRSGAKWDSLNENLEALATERLSNPLWQFNTTFLLMKSNINLLNESFDFAETYGADWGCGMIAGEHNPVTQCRTYLNENIFRFPHEGYSRQEIVSKLEAILPRAIAHQSNVGLANLRATIQQVETMARLDIDPEEMSVLKGMNNLRDLSKKIHDIVIRSGEQEVARVAQDVDLYALFEPEKRSKAHLSALDRLDEGRAALLNGNVDLAITRLGSALLSLTRIPGVSAEEIALARLDFGRAKASGTPREAVRILRRAWQELKSTLGPSNTKTGFAALELGVLLNRLGDHGRALAPLHSASTAFARLFGRQDDLSFGAVAAAELGKAMRGVSDPTAEAQLRRAKESMTAFCGAESSNTAYVVYELAQLFAEDGRKTQAREELESYLAIQLQSLESEDVLPSMTRFMLWKHCS